MQPLYKNASITLKFAPTIKWYQNFRLFTKKSYHLDTTFFIQTAGLAYHHRTKCGGYHQPFWAVYHHSSECIFLRFDDIQCLCIDDIQGYALILVRLCGLPAFFILRQDERLLRENRQGEFQCGNGLAQTCPMTNNRRLHTIYGMWYIVPPYTGNAFLPICNTFVTPDMIN